MKQLATGFLLAFATLGMFTALWLIDPRFAILGGLLFAAMLLAKGER